MGHVVRNPVFGFPPRKTQTKKNMEIYHESGINTIFSNKRLTKALIRSGLRLCCSHATQSDLLVSNADADVHTCIGSLLFGFEESLG